MTNRGLEPLYNVDCILRAFKIIQSRVCDATLTIAHDGPSRRHLEALARELQLNHVRFVGTIPRMTMSLHSMIPPDVYQPVLISTTCRITARMFRVRPAGDRDQCRRHPLHPHS